ncbi:MAG: hypothetical protein LBK43_04050 [Treponema sp.]|jgi:hypothetical protein|nr:hypothetical protein [Treponema sp.]
MKGIKIGTVRVLGLGLFLGVLLPVHAQTTTTGAFDTTGFPQWVKDLRRGEIVAFGSFPLTMLFTLTAVDLYRCANHDWDTRYAPWPAKSAGAVDMTKDEQMNTLAIAAASSMLIAVIDFFIVRYKRTKQARELEQLPKGVPIIIRKPVVPENQGTSTEAEAP